MGYMKGMWTIQQWGTANRMSFLSDMCKSALGKMSLSVNLLIGKPRLLEGVVKMPCWMWLFLLICGQKIKNWIKKSVYRNWEGEMNEPKPLFSENLPFPFSKVRSSTLLLLWNVMKVRNMKASSTTWLPERLQSPMAMTTAAQQLTAESVMRAQAGGPHTGQTPYLCRENPGTDAWQGTGCFADGAEQNLPVDSFLRYFGWPCHNMRAVPFSRWSDHKLWLQPSREIEPQVIVWDPNHFWIEITVLPGLEWYNKDRTGNN